MYAYVALELDEKYVKALVRRAHAYEAQEKYELALDGVFLLCSLICQYVLCWCAEGRSD